MSFKPGNAGIGRAAAVADESAQDDGFAVAHGDFGAGLALGGGGDAADAGDLHGGAELFDIGLNVHDHQAVGIDQRQDLQMNADLQLRVLRTGAAAVAVIIGAGDVRDGIADEQIGRHRVGSLNARTGEDVDPAVAGHGFQDDVEVIAKFGEIAEAAGKIGQGGAAGGGRAAGAVGGGGGCRSESRRRRS